MATTKTTARDRNGRKPDARSERWREHRIKVRAEIVDAVIRATEKLGPDVSMDDIAREAGAAKPKLYRHFADKTDLYNAVLDRLVEDLWARMVTQANLLQDNTSAVLKHGVDEYLAMVTAEPNLFRWITHSGIAMQAMPGGHAIESLRQIAERFDGVLRSTGDNDLADPRAIELLVFSVLGLGATSTEWWLGTSDSNTPPMSIEDFSTYLLRSVQAVITEGARMYGVAIDPDKPLPVALSVAVEPDGGVAG